MRIIEYQMNGIRENNQLVADWQPRYPLLKSSLGRKLCVATSQWFCPTTLATAVTRFSTDSCRLRTFQSFGARAGSLTRRQKPTACSRHNTGIPGYEHTVRHPVVSARLVASVHALEITTVRAGCLCQFVKPCSLLQCDPSSSCL